MSVAPALRRIEASLRALAEEAEIARIPGDELRTIARQVGCQAEMLEEGLAE